MSDEGMIKSKQGLFGGDVTRQFKLGEAYVQEMKCKVKFNSVQYSSMEILKYVDLDLWVLL